MVRIEENKLIIEIESGVPISELVNIQDALIESLKYYNHEETDGLTVFTLSRLLKELMPTFEQNKVLFSA